MTAVASAPPVVGRSTGELLRIPLADLIESPWNPRKHFDPAKLAEMVESLKKGQLVPIIVRPLTSRAGLGLRYEIGAGHRRFRAAAQAGLTSLLAVVRYLDDVAFLELLTIENKQRDDVEPLDEAAGFKLLMEKAGYDVAKLAARIGLSTRYVYDSLTLLKLIPELQQYLWDKVITRGHAILLARLAPEQQKKVMGNPKGMNRYGYRDGTGLFQPEHADHDPDQPALALKQPIKAKSVRELATYINDHVRFDPAKNDLPNLFPAAEAALKEAAAEDDLAPVYITYDYQLKFDAKDHKVRTYGVSSWHRADGKKRSKQCDWSRIGIVAAGRDRGDAFRVCVNRDKCDVHFKAARAEAKRRAAVRAKYAGSNDDGEDRWEREERIRKAQQKVREAERVRWRKAAPQLYQALAAALRKESSGPEEKIGRYLRGRETEAIASIGKEAAKHFPVGRTAEEFLRYIAYCWLAYNIDDPWDTASCIKELKVWGVDAQKIVDEVAPKPQPAKPPATKKAKKGGR